MITMRIWPTRLTVTLSVMMLVVLDEDQEQAVTRSADEEAR